MPQECIQQIAGYGSVGLSDGRDAALDQTISAGSANFFIDGDVIFGYGFVNLSDRALNGERPGHPGGGAAADLRCGGAANLRPHRRRQGADRLRGPGRAGQWEAGRDDVQDEEFGWERADGFGLSEAQRGALGRGQEAPEACGEAGEEEGPQGRLGLMLHHK